MIMGIVYGLAVIGAFYIVVLLWRIALLTNKKEAVTVNRQTDQINDKYRTTISA